MRLLSKIKTAVCTYILMKEWVENGEFHEADKVVVIGTKVQAAVVKSFFRKTSKKIYYCEKFDSKYADKNRTKWIIFDDNIKKNFVHNDYHVLIVPDI